MKIVRSVVSGFTMIGLVAGALVACATSGTGTDLTPTEPAADSGKGKGDDQAPPEADAGNNPGQDSGKTEEPPKQGECEAETKAQACVQCCSEKHQDGAAVYIDAVITCLCTADKCEKDCKSTLCATEPANADATCQACLNKAAPACQNDIGTACAANANCATYQACVDGSKCTSKPQ